SVTTAVQIGASLSGGSQKAFNLSLIAPAALGQAGIDATVWQDQPAASVSVTSPPFSTLIGNELLLAFVSAGYRSEANTHVSSVTGAGLTWALVSRTNIQQGTAEIWRAFAPATLTNVSVTATLSQPVLSSLTVVSFDGVDTSGVNGSGAIGAIASANGASGSPTASLTTTRDNSLLFAVGGDPQNAIARTPGSGQTLIHQDVASNQNTYWVQMQTSATPVGGTNISINDIAPSTDPYNLSLVEILPPATCTVAVIPASRLIVSGGGSTNVNVLDGSGCSWTATTYSPSWITLSGSTGSGNGTLSYTAAMNLGEARMGTVVVGGQSFNVLQGGQPSIQPFTDVLPTDPYFDYVTLMSAWGIASGCNATPAQYCPGDPATLSQMAVVIVNALSAAGISGVPYFQYLQNFSGAGIVAGCPSSCPDANVTQGQMAIFMIRAWMLANNLTSFTYTPAPYFTDVPTTDIYFSFIQKMRDLGFWTGCSATQYCESSNVTRDQMAALILRSIVGAP
ncbi:MAG: hypothetical protein ABI165_02065, partial [Bryobacteraceae bacterium]